MTGEESNDQSADDDGVDASDRLVKTLLDLERDATRLGARGQGAILAALVRSADALVALSGAVYPADKQEREDISKRVQASIEAVKAAIDAVASAPAVGGEHEE